jgi:hypothetical protein
MATSTSRGNGLATASGVITSRRTPQRKKNEDSWKIDFGLLNINFSMKDNNNDNNNNKKE